MADKIFAPKRNQPLVHVGGKPTLRTSEFLEALAKQADNVPDLTITWTTNEPTAGSIQTIADGTAPTAAELGQAVANLTAKVNAIFNALDEAGVML